MINSRRQLGKQANETSEKKLVDLERKSLLENLTKDELANSDNSKNLYMRELGEFPETRGEENTQSVILKMGNPLSLLLNSACSSLTEAGIYNVRVLYSLFFSCDYHSPV